MRRRRPSRIIDIAQAAGVGTATVDRVLNGRTGVTPATAERVRHAMNMLSKEGGDAPTTGRNPGFRFDVILPGHAGPSTDHLAQALQAAGEARGASVTCAFVEKMNPRALADALTAIVRRGSAGIAFQALDHPLVREAVVRLAEQDIPALALMSDLGGSGVFGFVGADNRAAGRTAGFLMGRFASAPGKVAVLWGGQMYRSHEEREIGFRTVVRSEFPHLTVLDLMSGRDDSDGNFREVRAVLAAHDDLVGIYSVGGGNRGYIQGPVKRVDGDLIYIEKEGEIRGTMHTITVHASSVRYYEIDIVTAGD